MRNIYLVGCGAVGCEFLKEFSKVCISQTCYFSVHVYDFDHVEDRNVCSQSFNYNQIGLNKAEAAAEAFSNPYCSITAHNKRVDESVTEEWSLDSDSIIIDAVDHLPTRKTLWLIGAMMKNPVLHLALSAEGRGVVGWNYGNNNGYVFDFLTMPKAQFEKLSQVDTHLPPCELNAFRTIISNVGISGAISVANYYGICSAGPLKDWLLDNKIGKTCKNLCAAYRINDTTIEYKKKPDTFYLGE